MMEAWARCQTGVEEVSEAFLQRGPHLNGTREKVA